MVLHSKNNCVSDYYSTVVTNLFNINQHLTYCIGNSNIRCKRKNRGLSSIKLTPNMQGEEKEGKQQHEMENKKRLSSMLDLIFYINLNAVYSIRAKKEIPISLLKNSRKMHLHIGTGTNSQKDYCQKGMKIEQSRLENQEQPC